MVRESCHPLREDVSWNISTFPNGMTDCKSSSSWGCELKLLIAHLWWQMVGRHPLREDVSWNFLILLISSVAFPSSSSWGCELKCCSFWCRIHRIWSSSSWGCELKCICIAQALPDVSHPLREDVSWNVERYTDPMTGKVILFVRMWVEISKTGMELNYNRSSSSWGCELKYIWWIKQRITMLSSSSWGCELK